MKIKKMLLGLMISLIVIASLLGGTDRPTSAQSASGPESPVMVKLAEVLQNQKAILDNLASIREELKIIKIRVSQNQ